MCGRLSDSEWTTIACIAAEIKWVSLRPTTTTSEAIPSSPWTGAIDVHTPFAAPKEIYRTRRIGSVRYRFPMLQDQENSSYEVRLHFIEAAFKEAGRRKFDVSLNDTKVLTDLDVYSEAGGDHRA